MATIAAKETPIGYGNMKRKEDARFIRGKGKYLDDIVLPGMLHGAVLRSPYAHARIVSIDTSRALAHPKVHRVITAKDLETLGLAWMPTLSYDSQAVLAGDKVRFQGQEVAFVIAEDRYSARDALPLIDVEYDPLPAVVNARKALDPDAPVIRDDQAGQDRQPGDSPLGGRRRRGVRARLRRGGRRPRAGHDLPALPSGPARDLRDDRRHEPGDGSARHLQRQSGAEPPPDRVRPGRRAARADDPDHDQRHRGRLREQGARLSGLRLRDRRLDRHRQAGQVGRGPLGEPDVHRLRARLHHERPDLRQGREDHGRAGRRDRRPRRLRQHGAALEVPRGVLPRVRRLLRPRGGALQRQGRLHEQGARRRGIPLLVPGHRGDLPDRAARRRARARRWTSTPPSCG